MFCENSLSGELPCQIRAQFMVKRQSPILAWRKYQRYPAGNTDQNGSIAGQLTIFAKNEVDVI
jgi:hypothetical protein